MELQDKVTEMRFSDEMLFAFHKEFTEHVQRYEDHRQQEAERMEALFKAQENNTKAIEQLIQETNGIVQLHKDLQAATRLGKTIQDLMGGIAKLGLLGAGVYALYQWVVALLQKYLGN